MIKHQRRSHQCGLHPSEILDDYTSYSEINESPVVPILFSQPQPMQGPLANHLAITSGHTVHQATLFPDFGPHISSYAICYQIPHQHSLCGDAEEYCAASIPEQRQSMHLLQHIPSFPQQPLYVNLQGNAEIATMNNSEVQLPQAMTHNAPEEYPQSSPPPESDAWYQFHSPVIATLISYPFCL